MLPLLPAVALTGVTAAPAAAHGIGGVAGTPVPGFVFAWAAAVVLVGSFAALGALWKRPRLERAPASVRGRLSIALEPVWGAIGIAVFAFVVVCGLTGGQSPTGNLLPTFVYVVFWVGLVPVSLLAGDVFSAVNPWRALGRATGWLAGRLAGDRLGPALPYPAWLGRWPATAAIAVFAWVELAYGGRVHPATLAGLALVYAALQLLGMALYGVETWTRRGDGFAVYFGLFGRLALLRRRPLLSGATELEPWPGTVALLCVMIGSTSFDGLSGTTTWRGLLPHLHDELGSVQTIATAGLVAMIVVIAAVYRFGVAGMRSVVPERTAGELARLFVHGLIPIAAAYVLAHYVTFLLDQGQAMAALISDPLDHGANWLGTADVAIHRDPLGPTATWLIQVTALVLGHVGGLVLAHDRALVLFADPRTARRSQQWMLTVMVGYTGLGLWLLSSLAR
jgi:hypothetical protein